MSTLATRRAGAVNPSASTASAPPCTLRPARETDLVWIADAAARLYDDMGSSLDRAAHAAALAELLRRPEAGQAWIVDAAGDPVGCAVVTRAFSLELGGPFGLLDELFVVPAAGGVGGGVLAHLRQAASAMGLRSLRLEVARHNPAARAPRAARLHRPRTRPDVSCPPQSPLIACAARSAGLRYHACQRIPPGGGSSKSLR